MESLPLTAEAIAFTEKKMDMTLEDIIKMSKKKVPASKKAPRQPVIKRPFQNGNSNQGNAKVERFMESRSSIRQGVLAQRRSSLDGNQFQITKQAAKKAATMPVRGRPVRWNKPSAPSTTAQRRPVSEALQNGKIPEQRNQSVPADQRRRLDRRLQEAARRTRGGGGPGQGRTRGGGSAEDQRRRLGGGPEQQRTRGGGSAEAEDQSSGRGPRAAATSPGGAGERVRPGEVWLPVLPLLSRSLGKEVQNQPPRTMDALFAQMKKQRMRIMPPPQSNATHGHQFNVQRRVQQPRRGRGYGGRHGGGNR